VARLSSSVSRPRRAACEPAPACAPIRSNAASTSVTPRLGSAAGGGMSRTEAQPTPICRCRSSPDRNATAGTISSGRSRRRQAASMPILPSRALDPATASDVPAIS
jgi:hypothetical protein